MLAAPAVTVTVTAARAAQAMLRSAASGASSRHRVKWLCQPQATDARVRQGSRGLGVFWIYNQQALTEPAGAGEGSHVVAARAEQTCALARAPGLGRHHGGEPAPARL